MHKKAKEAIEAGLAEHGMHPEWISGYSTAIIDMLDACHFAVVPVEPTEAMLKVRDGTNLSPEERATSVICYWQAMLRAATEADR